MPLRHSWNHAKAVNQIINNALLWEFLTAVATLSEDTVHGDSAVYYTSMMEDSDGGLKTLSEIIFKPN